LDKLLDEGIKHIAFPSPAFLPVLFVTKMIQVHIKFFLDEFEDLRLKDIIEHAVDIDRTVFLKGISCIAAASKLVENLLGVEGERI
jgi:hypothetical protein